ncbi:hypothetical protein V7x_18340 [Crateriforma conspicua]|uniref:Uncharacterized protein n=1 Tax=Crateriforma conspicua TaxID=2527996 RepID=A0A5C6FV61_9PLAN|nr:hypothetical protein V7x_18340 [Crateriforma conspicua]
MLPAVGSAQNPVQLAQPVQRMAGMKDGGETPAETEKSLTLQIPQFTIRTGLFSAFWRPF